jgi:SAM-dependent methyltransferase
MDNRALWVTAAAAAGAASCLLLGMHLGRRSNAGIATAVVEKTAVENAAGEKPTGGDGAGKEGGKRPRIKNKAYDIHQNWLACNVVVAGNEKEYHRCVRLVQRGENVLELGSHQGVTTRKIAARAGPAATCIGIDMSEFVTGKAKERARQEQSTAVFHHGDARDMRLARKLVPCDLQVIFIDVSGNRGPSTLMQLIESYSRCFKPRLIVVKSFKLENFHRVTKLSTEI